jgi:hypothetical protein
MSAPIETTPSTGPLRDLLLEQGLECPSGFLRLVVVAVGCASKDKVVAKICTLLVHHPVGHDLPALIVGPLIVELALFTASEIPSTTWTGIPPAHPFHDLDLLFTKGTLRHLVSSNRCIMQLFDNSSVCAYDFPMWTKKPSFTFLDHTADMGIIVRHRDLKGLFEAAAAAMMYIMVRPKRSVETNQKDLSISPT